MSKYIEKFEKSNVEKKIVQKFGKLHSEGIYIKDIEVVNFKDFFLVVFIEGSMENTIQAETFYKHDEEMIEVFIYDQVFDKIKIIEIDEDQVLIFKLLEI